MKKIAIVVQRYGNEIVGGSESLTMQYTQKLKNNYNIDIITTTCFDNTTWDNYYPEGEVIIDDIKVIRFKTTQLRIVNDNVSLIHNKILKRVGINEPTELKDDKYWIDTQGPYCPDLLNYISEHQHNYDAFVFMTYLYYPFVYGLPLAAYKSVIIPTAHDEPWIKLNIFKYLFSIPRYICFLTEEEKNIVHNIFKNNYIEHNITGTGIEVPEAINTNNFKDKFKINDKYIIYLGRIEESKGVGELIKYFIKYKKIYNSEIKLVLIGTGSYKVPERNDIFSVGYLDESLKYEAISGAEFLTASSRYESLCIALLEAFALKVPALVNGECEVLKSHIIKSKSGLYYTNKNEFIEATHKLITSKDRNKKMRENAYEYVNKNYTWKKVINNLCEAIEYVSSYKNN